jgi:hypothetical protein
VTAGELSATRLQSLHSPRVNGRSRREVDCVAAFCPDGEVLLHRHMKAAPAPFLKAITPYREGIVVAERIADLAVQRPSRSTWRSSPMMACFSRTGAFSGAASLFLRDHPAGPKWLARTEAKLARRSPVCSGHSTAFRQCTPPG